MEWRGMMTRISGGIEEEKCVLPAAIKLGFGCEQAIQWYALAISPLRASHLRRLRRAWKVDVWKGDEDVPKQSGRVGGGGQA